MQIDVNDLPEEIAEISARKRLVGMTVLDTQRWSAVAENRARHEGYKPKVRVGLFPDLFGDGYELPDDFLRNAG